MAITTSPPPPPRRLDPSLTAGCGCDCACACGSGVVASELLGGLFTDEAGCDEDAASVVVMDAAPAWLWLELKLGVRIGTGGTAGCCETVRGRDGPPLLAVAATGPTGGPAAGSWPTPSSVSESSKSDDQWEADKTARADDDGLPLLLLPGVVRVGGAGMDVIQQIQVGAGSRWACWRAGCPQRSQGPEMVEEARGDGGEK